MSGFIPYNHTPPEIHTGPEQTIWAVGIDLSLTGTGWATIGTDGIQTGLVKSIGHKGDSLATRYHRLSTLREQLQFVISDNTLVVIEQPAYAAVGGSHHDRSGLWWMVVGTYLGYEYKVAEVPPTVVKKFATGKGNADKDTVLAATIRRYPDANVSNNNVADAVTLAAMGARFMGHPQEVDTVKLLEAMAVVRWPA